MVYELAARFDSRKSFYGKAQVEDTTEGIFLYSYNRNVAKIIGGQLVLCPDWNKEKYHLLYLPLGPFHRKIF